MPHPQIGDILIRNHNADSFVLVDIVTGKHLSGPHDGFGAAVAAARARNVRAIWQQAIREGGRPLGQPFRLPDLD